MGVQAGMNEKIEVKSSGMDTVKLAASVLLLIAGIGAFYIYEEHSLLLRVLGLLVVAGIAIFVAMQTVIGRRVWSFATDARAEVRKVVWPSRQETIQTTLIVFVMVLIMGIILWLVDMALMAIVRSVTG
jgi:preprotein translocase subunit SecE